MASRRWSLTTAPASGAGVKIYFDGDLQAPTAEVSTWTESIRTAMPLKLGQRSNGGRSWRSGIVQDLRIYGRMLSDDEIGPPGERPADHGVVAKAGRQRTAAENDELFDWLAAGAGPGLTANCTAQTRGA